MMKWVKCGAAAAVLLVATPANATDYLLDFTGADACYGGGCPGNIRPTYGDTSLVNLTYRTTVGTVTFDTMAVRGNHGDLQGALGAAYTAGLADVWFQAIAGHSVTLNSLDFASTAYSAAQGTNTTSFRILDLAGNILFDSGILQGPGTGHATQVFNITADGGLRLQWGAGTPYGGYTNAVDNIRFSVNPTEVSGAVPEPGTWAMLLLGFGFIGTAIRRHRRRATLVSIA